MFAINHAATALVIKKRYPTVPLALLLVSVQFIEVLWVVFNFIGLEHSSTEPIVNTVRDIHLEHMPYSHSIASSIVIATLVWLVVAKVFKQRTVATALALGLISHIVLDVLTHMPDISLIPRVFDQKVGLSLYAAPMLAFFVETAYGLACWWAFKGSKPLLAIILAFNLADITFFSADLKGPEVLLANHPLWLAAAVGMQIVLTLLLVGLAARPPKSQPK